MNYAPSDHHQHRWVMVPGVYPPDSEWVYRLCLAEPNHGETVRISALVYDVG